MKFKKLFLCVNCMVISLLAIVLLLQYFPLTNFTQHNKLILISMDGFRHDYIEKVKNYGIKLPNFDYLISHGSRIMRMENAFPTITLPNHQTLVTGMYTESHGIVLNTFRDVKFNSETFDMNNQDNLNDPKWFQNWPDPIWVTLQKQGRLTASQLWPLTDSAVGGQQPYFQQSQFTYLDNSIVYNFSKRVDDIVRWLSDTHVSIDFAMLYFPEPDESGHAYGPNDPRLFKVIHTLDGVVGRLIDQLKASNMLDKVNIILTADHGMSELSNKREIALDDYVNPLWYTSTLLTPVGTLYPLKGKESQLYNGLKNKNKHLEVYWRHEVPAYLNYNQDNGRIAPLILIAENQWNIVHKKSAPGPEIKFGNHGYKPNVTDIQPVFLAHGPNFKTNFSMPMGHSVDVYPLMCHLLGIQGNPSNGSLNRINPIVSLERFSVLSQFLHSFKSDSEFLLVFILPLILVALSFILFCCFGCYYCNEKKRKNRIQYTKVNDEF